MTTESPVGKIARQVRCEYPEYQHHVGRTSKVVESFTDEKGNVQVFTADGIWCPLHLLTVEWE